MRDITVSEEDVTSLVDDLYAVFQWAGCRTSICLHRRAWRYSHRPTEPACVQFDLWVASHDEHYKFDSILDIEKFRNRLERAKKIEHYRAPSSKVVELRSDDLCQCGDRVASGSNDCGRTSCKPDMHAYYEVKDVMGGE